MSIIDTIKGMFGGDSSEDSVTDEAMASGNVSAPEAPAELGSTEIASEPAIPTEEPKVEEPIAPITPEAPVEPIMPEASVEREAPAMPEESKVEAPSMEAPVEPIMPEAPVTPEEPKVEEPMTPITPETPVAPAEPISGEGHKIGE